MTSHLTRRTFVAGAGLLAAAPLFMARADEAGPIRYVSFVTRAAGLTREDFLKAFHAQGAKAGKLPFAQMVFSDVIPPGGPARPGQLDTDGMIEIWVKNQADYARVLKSGAGRKWAAATDALLSRSTTYVSKEHVFTPVPQRDGKVKTLTLIVRKDGMTHAQYMEHWLGIHGPMATKVPGLIGFILTDILSTQPPKGELLMPECDGIAELWWDPVKGQPPGTMVNTADMRTWGADGNLFIQRDKSRNLTLEGHVYA